MNKTRNLILPCLIIIIISGCNSGRLFKIDDKNTEIRNYTYEITNNGITAKVEAHIEYDYMVYVGINFTNESNTDYLVSLDERSIWHGACNDEKVFLNKTYEINHGFDIDPYILKRGNHSGIGLTFNRPTCLQYFVDKEVISFKINLSGIYLQDRDGIKIDLLDEFQVYSRKTPTN